MSSVHKKTNGTSRRGFIKEAAAGGAAVAAVSAMLGWTAQASPLLTSVSQETSDGKSKYGKCIVGLPVQKMRETVMFSTGADLLNGFPCHIIYAFGLTTGRLGMSEEPHIHEFDEAVYFIGSDPKNADLGAKVNFQIGPGDGGEEDHIFSIPTVVVIPKGVWHCPMYALKVDRPFLCMAVSLTPEYTLTYWSKRHS
jgi:hypothetical protein